MKVITSRSRLANSNYGRIKVVSYYLFGRLKIWTEHHPYHPEEERIQIPEPFHPADLYDMHLYEKWRTENHFMRMTNKQFDRTLAKFTQQH